jgi:hypothetical protein
MLPAYKRGRSIRTPDIRCLIFPCKILTKYLHMRCTICSHTATCRQAAPVFHPGRAPPEPEVAEETPNAPRGGTTGSSLAPCRPLPLGLSMPSRTHGAERAVRPAYRGVGPSGSRPARRGGVYAVIGTPPTRVRLPGTHGHGCCGGAPQASHQAAHTHQPAGAGGALPQAPSSRAPGAVGRTTPYARRGLPRRRAAPRIGGLPITPAGWTQAHAPRGAPGR